MSISSCIEGDIAVPVLRVARPSDDFAGLLQFYVEGLGFSVLSRFEDHDGFDGLILGHPAAPWHLEFTRRHGEAAPRAPGPEHLLVLYLPEMAAWEAAVERLRASGFMPVAAANPYWDRAGATFEDPDGYRVVLQRDAWTR